MCDVSEEDLSQFCLDQKVGKCEYGTSDIHACWVRFAHQNVDMQIDAETAVFMRVCFRREERYTCLIVCDLACSCVCESLKVYFHLSMFGTSTARGASSVTLTLRVVQLWPSIMCSHNSS